MVRSKSPAPKGDKKGKGKGKGKDGGKKGGKNDGKGTDKDKGKKGDGKGGSKGGQGPWVPKLYCQRFVDIGKCDVPGCIGPHFDRDEVAGLKAVLGDKCEKYIEVAKKTLKESWKNK